MEQLRKIIDLCRQHYEKLVLSGALLILAIAVLSLWKQHSSARLERLNIPRDFERLSGKPVPPVDLSDLQAALKLAGQPRNLELSGPHNLFNPVKWQQQARGAAPIKVVHGDEIGPKAMRIVAVRPYHLTVGFEKAAASGSGADRMVSGYWLVATNESYQERDRLRIARAFMNVNATNPYVPFILREVKGNPEEPESLAGELKEFEGERFTFAPDRPFVKVIGHEVNLRFPGTDRTTGFKRKGDELAIEGQTYKVVDITSNSVLLSDTSNDRRYVVDKFVAQ